MKSDFFKYIPLIAALIATIQACSDRLETEPTESEGNFINLTISLGKEDLADVNGTKVTLGNDGNLQWEGDESIGIIFARTAAANTEYRYVCPLGSVEGKAGVFSGTVNPGEFKTNEIVGIVYPYNTHCWGKYHKSSGKRRIVLEVAAEDQIQRESGVLNGDCCPLFAEVSFNDFKTDGKGYLLEGKKLQWGCSLFRFDVYGIHPKAVANEKVESVELFATTTKCCAGTAEHNIGGGFAFNGNTKVPYLVTRLSTPAELCADEASGVILYSACLPRGETGSTVKFTRIFVVTDKAVYQKAISKDVLLMAGEIHPVKLNLSTFERTSRSVSGKAGRDSLFFLSNGPLRNRPVKVYYYSPSGFNTSTTPFLFSMHGSGRTGLSHLKMWESTASSKKVFVMAPEFTKELYSINQYQFGGISSSSDKYDPQPEDEWTYGIVEELFDLFRTAKGSSRTKYDMWGHSAGGQFTHRFLLNMPKARIDRAIGSNAGCYTVPDPGGISDGSATYGFPYSIMDMDISTEQLKQFFARNYTVHLGTADRATTLEEDSNLPVSPGAKAQGACRFDRGHFFYDRAKRVADSLSLPFNWKLVEVAGVAHSGTNMAQKAGTGAAALLY